MKNKIREYIFAKFNVSFSKSGDDIQVRKLLASESPGTYVDIGCWHPKKASNTYFFYLRNWRGICIDPNPELKPLYDRLRPNDTFVNCGVGQQGELTYYMLNKDWSSMNTFNADFIKIKGIEQHVVKTIPVPVRPLSEILDAQLKPGERLDFFDIDVEGMDLQVLQTNDWNKYRPKIVVIETDLALKADLTSDTVKYLEAQNYSLVGKSVIKGNLGNLFLIDNNANP